MDQTSNSFAKRLKPVIWCSLVAVFIIIARLFHLQIQNFSVFFSRGERNCLRIEKVYCPRGTILDCKGRPLATNKPITDLYWQGTGNKTFNANQDHLCKELQKFFNKNEEEMQALQDAERTGRRILIASDISYEILCFLIEQYPSDKNIYFTTNFKRSYPHNAVASHILGYLAHENNGQMGLEKIYEEELRGTPGELRHFINARGIQLAEEETKKAQRGSNLTTTIDLDLQEIAEEVFPPETSGVMLVMNPRNGALRVVVSRPAFDPNIFINPLDQDQWEDFQNARQPFLNRAFNAVYPPASLFKLVTISAALETNLVKPDDVWFCPGYYLFAGTRRYCHLHSGHGRITTMQAVAKSCNIPFYDIGRRIKIDTLAEYAHRFGLGMPTNGAFPERAGLIPTTSWKRKYKSEPWWPGETLSAAIGQSFTLVTPVQIVRMISAIGEGYLVRPCIIEREANNQEHAEKETLQISPKTRSFLLESMRNVVAQGTGQRLARFTNMEIYGKTGTAQTCSLEKNILGGRYKDHAWFVTYIKYRDYQPMVLLILLENSGLSTCATHVAQQFLERYCKLADKPIHKKNSSEQSPLPADK